MMVRSLGLLSALGMAFAPVSTSYAVTYSAGSQQLNPKAAPCCDCLSMKVNGQSSNISGAQNISLQTNANGDLVANVEVEYLPASSTPDTCGQDITFTVEAWVLDGAKLSDSLKVKGGTLSEGSKMTLTFILLKS